MADFLRISTTKQINTIKKTTFKNFFKFHNFSLYKLYIFDNHKTPNTIVFSIRFYVSTWLYTHIHYMYTSTGLEISLLHPPPPPPLSGG